jgi:hypothetical protein
MSEETSPISCLRSQPHNYSIIGDVFNLRAIRNEKGGQDRKDKGKDERKARYRCEWRSSTSVLEMTDFHI